MLEGSDRTVGVGEGGLKMCEDLCRRPGRGFGREVGRGAPRPQRRAGVAFVVSAQIGVPNQRADNLAMRTRRLLELFSKRAPFLLAAVKPSLLAHVCPMPRENR